MLPGRLAVRWLGLGSPLPRKSLVTRLRTVVDDILNSAFDRQSGRRRGVIDLREQPPPETAADQPRTAPSAPLDQGGAEHADAGPIKGAGAKQRFRGRRGRDDALQIADPFRCPARFCGLERLGGILT
jgi:hypothetical protein